ncbi:unnamed protein product [Ilex paraguariensis]|uniref:Uncharacterized protein n=1 Tax=Ilex paraguariensis TaxID=185542 RepID=A0ABC8SFJ3_9AQUA
MELNEYTVQLTLYKVIQYIQFLQEKMQMYEGTYQGWSPEPSKLMPWRNTSGPADSFIDQSQLMKNDSGHEDNTSINPALLTNAQNSLESDFGGAAAYKAIDHSSGAVTQAIPFNMPLQPNLFDAVPAQSPQRSLCDAEHLASESRSHLWQGRPCTTDCAVPSYAPNEQEELKSESGEATISNAWSQGLVNTLSHALQSSGVDLSQTSISVQLDIGKQTNTGLTATTFSKKDHENPSPNTLAMAHYGFESNEESSRAPKRLRTEKG